MKDPISSVAEFHRTFQHPIEENPVIPSEARSLLRYNLLAEELEELKVAIQEKDLTEIADALCDLQYVLSGAVLEFGLKDKFWQLFAEVQRSNMSKACLTEQEALETQAYYLREKDTKSVIEKHGAYWLVFRTADRKTLKNIHYSPADLSSILTS